MESKSQKTPEIHAGISEYIRKNFREDFLTKIKERKDKSGELFYFVDVSHEDQLYHLKYNSRGELVAQELEPFPHLPDNELGAGD